MLGGLGTGRCQQRGHVRHRIPHSAVGIHPGERILYGGQCHQPARLAKIEVLLSNQFVRRFFESVKTFRLDRVLLCH